MRSVVFALFFPAAMALQAQTETDIRKHYTDVNVRIGESLQQGYEGPLYNNQWITNKNGKSWPVVGRYSETTDFWYDDTPDHLSGAERNPRNVLLKVMVNRKAAGYSVSEEYLYKDGKLLFYYFRETQEGRDRETRAYFTEKGVMFQYGIRADGKELTAADLEKEEYNDWKPHSSVIMPEGKKYQELFIKSM